MSSKSLRSQYILHGYICGRYITRRLAWLSSGISRDAGGSKCGEWAGFREEMSTTSMYGKKFIC